MKRPTNEQRACELCGRVLGEGAGQCAFTGSRGCKIAQGKWQLRTLRTGRAAPDGVATTNPGHGQRGSRGKRLRDSIPATDCCPTCDGYGNGPKWTVCLNCGGSGRKPAAARGT